ncbi:hypothetical protein D9619_010582 [Psilocybe cf. subviscida]|uniref:F-box domain-containing protein n=1 Tax=Psilocybe cf. subviscida TaxID=2480587 RepID=A0A8H5ASG9_9AGAR|nr:hypothetical protein D9619_010582 [Psilocybe cf. subviscida]
MDSNDIWKVVVAGRSVPKTGQNLTCAPISKLPNEILVEIFTILKSGSGFFYCLKSWHKVAHVCQHWRQVAIEAASLWTELPTHHHEYTLLMLARARMRPLDVTLSELTPKPTRIAVLDHLGRIRSLTVDLDEDGIDDVQEKIQNSNEEASKLTMLKMSTFTSPGHVYILPASTFRNFTFLKTLKLFQITLEWQLCHIRSLTVLCLYSVPMSDDHSWTQLKDALGRMPHLETLSLCNVTLPASFRPSLPYSTEPIQLLRLRTFSIDPCSASLIRDFISRMTFPSLRAAHMACMPSDRNSPAADFVETNRAMLSLITRNLDRLDYLNLAPCVFKMNEGGPESQQKGRQDLCIVLHTPPLNAINSNNIIACDTMRSLAELPGDPTWRFQHLTLSLDLAAEQLVEIFGHLPRLESITVISIPSQNIIESLKISPLHPPDELIAFSHLRSLTFRSFNEDYDSEKFAKRECEGTPALLDDLCKSLMMRYEYGSPVSELSLVGRKWQMTSNAVQRLREIVTDVEIRCE